MRVGARTLRLASKRLANGSGEFRRQRSLDADQGHVGIAALEPDLDAVCRVRIDYDPVTLRKRRIVARRSAWLLLPETNPDSASARA